MTEGEVNFKSFADTLVNIASRLMDRMIDELFKPFEDALLNMIRSAESAGSGSGGLGSILGSIGLAILGGVVGSGTEGAFANTAPGGTGRVGGGREHGGPVQAGQAYIVGERRPEIFVPNTSGVILPRVPSGGDGSPGIDKNIEQTNNLASFVDTMVSIAALLKSRLKDELFKPFGSATGASPIPSFAHGGSFTVGGSPGIDNNLIQFNASRGERVDITPAGAKSTGGEAPNIVIEQTNNFALDDVNVQAQILAAAPQIAEATKAAVLDTVRRGGRFKSAFS